MLMKATSEFQSMDYQSTEAQREGKHYFGHG
jgi:hypothetical protein